MNPTSKRETVGHRLIVQYRGASRNAASVILTVWLVGMASWFVNASAIYTAALAIEPGPIRSISLPISDFMKQISESSGVGSVESVIDRIRNRDRDGISLVDETIGAESIVEVDQELPEPELLEPESRPGDGIVTASIPVLNPLDFKPEQVGKTIRVLVTGDSLSTFAGQELVKLLAADSRFVVRIEWANGSGLTKPNVLDWAQYARDLTTKYQPDLVIMILGGSDTGNMVTGGELVPRGSEQWVTEYSRRIQLVTQEFISNNVTNVVWAGPPVVSDKNRNLSYRQVNQSLADTSLLIPELKYLDAFTNLQPDLSATINGNRILLRQADGIHWTREASAVIATELKAMLAALRP